jgi:NADH-quinone oxidoreductase subunit E
MRMNRTSVTCVFILENYKKSREYLIPILQDIQAQYGYLSKQSIWEVSDYLELPESKIYGVATFYNQFRLDPPGKYRIQVCRGTACHVKGSFNLLKTLKHDLGIDIGQTTRDGLFSMDTVACLGACSIAPVLTINGQFYGRLDKERIKTLLSSLKKQGVES